MNGELDFPSCFEDQILPSELTGSQSKINSEDPRTEHTYAVVCLAYWALSLEK